MIEQECVVVSSDVASNFAVDRTAGSHSLAAAGHCGVRGTTAHQTEW
jgi:hypothetical protein